MSVMACCVPSLEVTHLPLALKLASGTVMFNLLKRHSRPALLRGDVGSVLMASISTRPIFLPRNSRSSTTMSKAGMATGESSSKDSTV